MKNKFLLVFILCISFLSHSKLLAQCTATIFASTTSVCSGQPVTLLVITQNCGSNLQFLWSTGQNAQSITINPVDTSTVQINVTFSVTVTSVSGSVIASKQITVRPYPAVIISNNTPTLCNGSNTSILLSSLTPSTAYTWNAVANNLTGIVNGSGSFISQTLVNLNDSNGTATYTVIPTYSGCIGTAKSTTVILHQRPELTVINNSENICSGEETDIQLLASLSGSTFAWTSSAFYASGNTSDSGSFIIDTLSATLNGTGSVDYDVTATHDGCSCSTIQTSVNVKPIPILNFSSLNPNICNGDSVVIALSSIPQGATFNWTVTAGNVNGALNGNGDTINQLLTATNPPAYANYSIIANLDGCVSSPVVNTVFIKKSPDIFFAPVNSEICSGSAANIHLSSNPPGASFSWSPAASSITGASNGNGNIINQLLTNSGNDPDFVIYNTSAMLNGCTSSVSPIPVLVKPIPSVLLNSDTSFICNGSSTNIQLSSAPPGAYFEWTAFANNLNGYSNGNGNIIAQSLSTTSDTGSVVYTIIPVLNQCQGTAAQATVIVSECLGIKDNNEPENFIRINPNPVNDQSVLTLPLSISSKVSFIIFNHLGKKIFVSSASQVNELFKQSINTSRFESGVYTVVVFINQSVFTKQLVVVH